jgi:hypothetical protein
MPATPQTEASEPPNNASSTVKRIDEEDPSEPYSLRSIKENFKEASVVVLANVTAMKPDNMDRGYRPYTSTAEIREVFKGNVRKGQIIKVRSVLEVYDEELIEEEFLSERVLWLHQRVENDGVVYGMIEFMAQEVKPNFLEKIRKVARSKVR